MLLSISDCVDPLVEMPSDSITVWGLTCTAPSDVSDLYTSSGVL